MVLEGIPTGYEIRFLIDIGIVLGAGFAIGAERESRNKPAGISTHCLVIGGAMIFTFLSSFVDANSSSRIAAQVVSGIGFLGAGIILKSEVEKKITNPNHSCCYMVCCSNWHGNRISILLFGSCGYSVCRWSAANTSHFKIGKKR